MGIGLRQKMVREYRGQMASPGRPTVAWREDRVRFWAAIARGAMTEDAATEAGGVLAGRVPMVPACWRRESWFGSDGFGSVSVLGRA